MKHNITLSQPALCFKAKVIYFFGKHCDTKYHKVEFISISHFISSVQLLEEEANLLFSVSIETLSHVVLAETVSFDILVEENIHSLLSSWNLR